MYGDLGGQELLKEHHDMIIGITDVDFVIDKYQSGVFLPFVLVD